jgi:hypothetical protein
VDDIPYTGDGHFKFAVVNAAGTTSYWSNDGTSTGGGAPTAAVPLVVSEGLFSVLLGDTTLSGMTQALAADVFSQPDRYLRVWFSTSVGSTFSQLTPDTRIASVPYALQAQEAVDADTVDGLHASELATHYQNVVVVAKSGGDYTSVQAAIASITDAAADNAYLVWVAPGMYNETVTMKPYVHLQGAGQEATIITSATSDNVWPPTQATLLLASDTSLRDLTVANSGTGDVNAAVLATAGVTPTLLADVTVRATGSGTSNVAIMLTGSGTGATLQQVTALAENGSGYNSALNNRNGAAMVLHGGAFTGRGGEWARGVSNSGGGTKLVADNVTALGEDGSIQNFGLHNNNGAAAALHGGSFTARGGVDIAWGIFNGGSGGTTLDAIDVTALGENASSHNLGLGSYQAAVLRGCSFTGRGGTHAFGINISGTLEADNVTALGEEGSSENYGLENYAQAEAVLRGGSFTARGGADIAAGIHISGTLTTLGAESVTVLGEDGSTENYGLHNSSGVTTKLRGGSFTGRGGTKAYGIYSANDGTTLEAESIAALGENGSSNNFGLENSDGAVMVLHSGSFTGRGGTNAWGLLIDGSGTTLEAHNVTALGEDASMDTYGLHSDSGAAATLYSSAVTGRGGTFAKGIYNASSDTTLEAHNVTSLGEDASSGNYGLLNEDSAEAVLRGGSFTASGGTFAHGILSQGSSTTLEADSVTALGENGSSNNFGLENSDGAVTVLRGGSFTASGGTSAYGIFSHDIGTTLEADSITALGKNSSGLNFGMENYDRGVATLRGGSFTGRGGNGASGVQNTLTSTLTAEGITALAEGSSTENYGLVSSNGVTTTLHGGSFTGRAGTHAYGVYNDGTLEAENASSLGEGAGIANFGLYNLSGTMMADNSQFTGSGLGLHLEEGAVYLAFSQLDGGALNIGGAMTCYGVYDETYAHYPCP